MPRWLQVAETVINHFLPERSNATEEVAAVAPDYWKPKAMVAANAKAKPTNNGKVNAPDTSKMDDEDEQQPRKVALVQFGKMSAGNSGDELAGGVCSSGNARGIPLKLASPSTCVEVIICTVSAFRFGVAMRRITTLSRGLATVSVCSLNGRYGGEYAFACVRHRI